MPERSNVKRKGGDLAFTFFFRDREVLETVVDRLVPRVLGRSRIRVWDAGCAAGEEAYTLAMLLAERLGPHTLGNLRIDATDQEESKFPHFERIIEAGVYAKADVEHVPGELFKKYFEPCGTGFFRVSDELRKRVFFTRHDLLTRESIGNDFSLVVCKNVLLHLPPHDRVEVVKMFHRSLLPKGLMAFEHSQGLPEGTGGLFVSSNGGPRMFEKVEV